MARDEHPCKAADEHPHKAAASDRVFVVVVADINTKCVHERISASARNLGIILKNPASVQTMTSTLA